MFIGYHLTLSGSESRGCLGKFMVSPFWAAGRIVPRGLSLEYAEFEQPKPVELTCYYPASYYLYLQLTVGETWT